MSGITFVQVVKAGRTRTKLIQECDVLIARAELSGKLEILETSCTIDGQPLHDAWSGLSSKLGTARKWLADSSKVKGFTLHCKGYSPTWIG